jgi:hypothetical protein
MNTFTELGVYILGAVALAGLLACGIASGDVLAQGLALLACGAAYVSQVSSTYIASGYDQTFFPFVSISGWALAIGLWCSGVGLLLA